MLIPTKYDNINKTVLVLGAKIIKKLKKQPYNVDELYRKSKAEFNISLELFYDILTFLWLANIIEKMDYQIFLKGKK